MDSTVNEEAGLMWTDREGICHPWNCLKKLNKCVATNSGIVAELGRVCELVTEMHESGSSVICWKPVMNGTDDTRQTFVYFDIGRLGHLTINARSWPQESPSLPSLGAAVGEPIMSKTWRHGTEGLHSATSQILHSCVQTDVGGCFYSCSFQCSRPVWLFLYLTGSTGNPFFKFLSYIVEMESEAG